MTVTTILLALGLSATAVWGLFLGVAFRRARSAGATLGDGIAVSALASVGGLITALMWAVIFGLLWVME